VVDVDIVCARVIQVGRIPITRPYLGVLRLASVALTKSTFRVDSRRSASGDGSVGAIVPVVRICLVRFSTSAAKPIFAFFRVGLLWKQGIDFPFNSSLRFNAFNGGDSNGSDESVSIDVRLLRRREDEQ
jgi:hypothetical protein